MRSVLAFVWFALAGIFPCHAEPLMSRGLRPCSALKEIVEGDTLKIYVYEILSSRDEGWSKVRGIAQGDASFALRTEFSGEFKIGLNGALFLPLLGSFRAAGVTPEVLAREIAAIFKNIFNHESKVDLVVSQHKPVFVAGYVASPGKHDYFYGMTLVHAVALSGGPLRVQGVSRRSSSADLKFRILREEREGVMEQTISEPLTQICPGDVVMVLEPPQ